MAESLDKSERTEEDVKKNVALYGVMVALAFIFSYVESLIPFGAILGIPGVKLGLANLVVLVALYTMRTRDAFVISIVRIVLVGFSFGNMYSSLYGLCGGLLSFAVMALLRKADWFGMMGVSLVGGIFHNLGQLMVAIFIVENVRVAYYFPPLILAGTVAGAVIGIVGKLVVSRVKHLIV